MICTFSITAFAQGGGNDNPRVVDNVDKINPADEAELTRKLDSISEKYQFDVVVVTTDSFDGKSVEAYADDFFDNHGYGFGSKHDGVILVVNPISRDLYISTFGYGKTAFTDYDIEQAGEKIKSYLSNEDYAKAFDRFADIAEDYVKKAKDVPFNWVKAICIGFGSGLAIAIILLLILLGQLKSVRRQNKADYYTRPGSMQVTEKREFYLYRKVDKTRKAQNNSSGGSSTHISSSGRSHGGGGGKF